MNRLPGTSQGRITRMFGTCIVAIAIALPVAVIVTPTANADTLKEMTTRGIVLTASGFDIDVTYTPDGKFTAMEGQVTGTWRIAGETLCTTDNFRPAESCVLYPRDKVSGDKFDLETPEGVVTIRIK